MLLDMLVAIAGQDYGGGRQCASVGFAPPCPGRRDPKPRHLLRGGEAFFVLA